MSGAAVVEGSGGASIQNLVKAVLANASATGRFGNAGLTFAPTDSDQVTGLLSLMWYMPAFGIVRLEEFASSRRNLQMCTWDQGARRSITV